MTAVVRKYGLKKSPPQPTDRDLVFSVGVKLPPTVDLRLKCPAIYDQGDLGSCTANAGCCAVEFDMRAQKQPLLTTSRLFLYYNERVREGDVPEDAGASLSTCIQSIGSDGVCSEALYPYLIAHFTEKPSPAAYAQAKLHKGLKSFVLHQNLYELQHCLAIVGRPFIFGIEVYESFESDAVAKTGIVPMPHRNHEKLLGGHAICCVGYKPGYLICRNSWGVGWGDHGYLYLPNAYALDPQLSSDFWCLQTIK